MRQNRSWSLLSAIILASGLVWIWISRVNPNDLISAQIFAPRPGFRAPTLSLPDVDGNIISLSDLHGRPVVINFWASWCLPCRQEMPALQKIYREYHDQGLEIIAVNVADQDTLEKAKAFASEYGLEFLVLYDSKGEASASYSVNSLPTTFFVDPNGTIQEVVVVGPMAEALIRVRVENLFTK